MISSNSPAPLGHIKVRQSAPSTSVLGPVSSGPGGTPTTAQALGDLKCVLYGIDPECDANSRSVVLQALKSATANLPGGLELAAFWSSRSKSLQDQAALARLWADLPATMSPWTAAQRLLQIATEHYPDSKESVESLRPSLEAALAPRVEEPGPSHGIKGLPKEGLGKYSLVYQLDNLEREMVEQRECLGSVALFGQSTVLYAKPNTGKTLIILDMIVKAIRAKRIDPAKLYYINVDDSMAGLVEKGRIAQEYGFHMLSEGYQNFRVGAFRNDVISMIEKGTAKGAVVILDTLKAFVNTMDKAKSSQFTRLMRDFVLKGGTVVALSHTNKKPGFDGKAVYAGTTDIVDDFDCSYIVSTLTEEDGERVVEFENNKRRGNVSLKVAYSYALQADTYSELLSSVNVVDPNRHRTLKQEFELQSDAQVITAIESCIAEGFTKKMELAYAVADRAQVSRQVATRTIEKYTGNNPEQHRWSFMVRDRGAKVFSLLPRCGAVTNAQTP